MVEYYFKRRKGLKPLYIFSRREGETYLPLLLIDFRNQRFLDYISMQIQTGNIKPPVDGGRGIKFTFITNGVSSEYAKPFVDTLFPIINRLFKDIKTGFVELKNYGGRVKAFEALSGLEVKIDGEQTTN